MNFAVMSDGYPTPSGPAHPRSEAEPSSHTPDRHPGPNTWLNEIAAAAATGERQAVDQLARQIQPMIQRYCRARIGRATGGYEAADDVAQEACLGIFAALPGYRGKEYPFTALAYRIAANKVADHYRRNASNRSVPVENPPEHGTPESTPETAALNSELGGRLRLLLGVLGAREREIITLRVVVGMSAEETAQAIDSTRGAIRVAQHRALVKLRAALPASELAILQLA